MKTTVATVTTVQTVNARVDEQIKRLNAIEVDIEHAIAEGLKITKDVIVTESEWRGSRGMAVRTARRLILKLDMVLRPDKYQRAKKEPQAKRDANALFNINGEHQGQIK